MHILIVEDDLIVSSLLEKAFSEQGDLVVVERDGQAGFNVASSLTFDVIILDVMIPSLDGFAFARKLRSTGSSTPILMLTARDTSKDVIDGLDIGADDYLTKPFALDVLFARVRSLIRRGMRPIAPSLRARDLSIDPSGHEARRGETTLKLTKTEYLLLELLVRNVNRTVTRQSIIEAIWGYGADIENNTLDAFVSLLRSKVDLPGTEKLIHTVRGIGYIVKAPL